MRQSAALAPILYHPASRPSIPREHGERARHGTLLAHAPVSGPHARHRPRRVNGSSKANSSPVPVLPATSARLAAASARPPTVAARRASSHVQSRRPGAALARAACAGDGRVGRRGAFPAAPAPTPAGRRGMVGLTGPVLPARAGRRTCAGSSAPTARRSTGTRAVCAGHARALESLSTGAYAAKRPPRRAKSGDGPTGSLGAVGSPVSRVHRRGCAVPTSRPEHRRRSEQRALPIRARRGGSSRPAMPLAPSRRPAGRAA